MATFNDVTERRERERELRETTLTLEALLSALPDVVTLKDDRGVELEGFDSSAPETLLAGDPSAAAGGQDVAEVFPPATAARVRKTIRQAIDTDDVQTCEYQLDVPAGPRWFEAKVAPLEEPIDGTPAVVWVARDITERKQHERELRRQNDRLERFANVVSHDLRNPLSVAVGHAELLADEDHATEDDHAVEGHDDEGHDDDHAVDDHAAIIRANLERMEAIVDDVLDLARDGEAVETTDRVPLSTVAREAWRQVETAAATLRVEDAVVAADRDRCKRLFENLFRNSVQHAGGDVSVRIGPLPDGFYVEDDGPGIPEADRSRIFEAGYTTAEGGTGLGLNIVREIARSHGWTVEVVTGSDGGARFEFEGVTPEHPPATD